MRNKTSMMQPTNFTDFNPLDVLAAAASLQRRTEESAEDEESNENRKTGSGTSAEGDDDDAQDGADDDEDKADTVNCGVTPAGHTEQPPEHKEQATTEQCPAEQDGEDGIILAIPAIPSGSTETGHVVEPLDADASEPEQSLAGNSTPGVVLSISASTTVAIKVPLVSNKCDRTAVPITPPPVHRVVGAAVGVNGTRTSQMVTDHSYAFVAQLQSLKADEDEGYSSRSSLDDDSEETVSRLNHKNAQFLTGWVARPSSALRPSKVAVAGSSSSTQQEHSALAAGTKMPACKQPTKLMIVSKDSSNLQQIVSGMGAGSEGAAQLIGSSNGSSIMLRTLLGQKAKAAAAAALPSAKGGHSKVIIAGGLSGRVINVLKSGRIALAPPREANKLTEEAEQPEALLINMKCSLETGETEKAVDAEQNKVLMSAADDAVVVGAITDSAGIAGTDKDHAQSAQAGPVHTDCGAHGLTVSSISMDHEESSSLITQHKQSPNQLDISSRHGSDGVTDDETSCESSKCDIMVDTTPIMSPNIDFTSPLMSPVCERDVPMLSPMVGSPEIMCDILASCIKQQGLSLNSSLLPSKEQCNLTVSCVINEDVGGGVQTMDPAAETDSDVPAEGEGAPAVTAVELSATTTSEETCSNGTLEGLEGSSHLATQGGTNSNLCTDQTLQGDNDTPQAVIDNSSSEAETSQPKQLDPVEVAIPTPPTTPSAVNGLSPVSDLCAGGSELAYEQNETEAIQTEEDQVESVVPSITEQQSVGDQMSSSSLRNQYIIEDDESPVAKFGTPLPRSNMNEDANECSGSSPLAMAISSPSTDQNQPTAETSVDNTVAPGVKPYTEVAESSSESVKVIMTTDTSTKSVFTAVRRPLVTGMKAIPGSLHMVPVVPSTKVKSGLMHVLPVSGARGLVTQIIPKVGRSQFITGLPVLTGKTVVLPDNGKGRMNTLLVPVSIGGTTSSAAPISLVQTTTKTKLANMQQSTLKTVDLSEEAEPVLSPKTKRSELSSPLIFHGRITPISTTSDTSELLSSPESSLQGGFSGVIMGGGKTPDNRLDSPQPKDKMSIKISSSSVMESDDSMSSEPSFSKKETIGIGMMGSLSWKNIESCLPRGLTPIGVGGLGGREFVRIQGGELRTGIQVSDEDSMPPLEKPLKRPGRVPKTPDGKGGLYSRKRNKLLTTETNPAPPPPGSENYVPQVAQLHPLIDHDYCMFTEFNAQIQSSIIATTESKTKIEKKYAKKTKAVRTKAVRGLITEESLKGVCKGAVEKIISKGRRGRLKKRRASKDKVTTDEEVSLDGMEDLDEPIVMPVEEKITKKIVEIKPSRTSERRAKLQALKDDKNYVKITGSYQDEFVYFATKNKRNRPRKSLEDQNSQLLKKQQVGGMAVFDWYKDLSKGDKTSRFGTPTTSCPSSPVPSFGGHIEINGTHGSIPSALARHTSLGTPGATSVPLSQFTAPVHDSIEVADLVNDLTSMTTLGSTDTTATAGNDIDLSSYIIGTQDIKTEATPAMPSRTNAVTSASEIAPVSVEMAEMAEQVREMLNCMGADELENLELKFGGVDPAVSAMADSAFDGLLGGFTQETVAPVISQTATSNLIDLDEINDSDLLQSDLGGLLDVKPTTNTLKPSASVPALVLGNRNEHPPTPAALEFGDVKLDKTELFPDMAPPPAPVRSTDVSILAAQTAPELTVVSMYWNDLPGLVLMGQQYVRLVDIHKQVLPAKDTGILKKRCQMMGLSIANCSELQRDFLVRYANAAKSKSTVIVDKEAAQTLIGFYVEPKSRPSKQAVEERGIQLAKQARAQAAATARQLALPATPGSSPGSRMPAVGPATQSTPMNIAKRAGGVKSAPGIRRKRQLTSGSTFDASFSPRISPVSNDVKRSARLRYKKVCYADMLLGNHYDNQERKEDDSIGTQPPSIRGEHHTNADLQFKVPSLSSSSEESQENKNNERLLFPEDIEIIRLKNGAKYDSLNPKEKRRLRRLREKVRKRELKRKLRVRRKITRLNGQKKGTVMAMALAKIAAKTQKKLQQTHLFNRKHNQEHCYAAAPESPKKQYPEEELQPTPDILVDDHPPVKVVIEAVQSVPLVQIKVDTDIEVLTPTEDDAEMAPVVVDDLQPPSDSDSDSDQSPEAEVKEEPAMDEPVETVPLVAEKTPVPKSQSSAVARRVKRPPLAVLHRDAVQRLSQRSRWQDGQLHLDAFTDRQAACISCTTCSELLTVKRFMKHMHHQKNRDELAHVTLTQTLEMRAPEAASSEDHATWSDFKKRQAELMGPPPPAPSPAPRRVRPGPAKVKAPAIRAKAVGRPAMKPHHVTRTVARHPAGGFTPNGAVSTGSSVVSSQIVQSTTSNTPSSTSPSTPQHAAPTATAVPSSSSQLRGNLPSPALTPVGKASSLRRHSAAATPPPPPSPQTATPTRARTVSLVHTPPHSNLQTDTSATTATTPASFIRHSTRVRKQKQLHPIERYVFSGGISPPICEPPAKRPRLSSTSSSSGDQAASSPVAAPAPVRKVRLRLSTATTAVKYDLRANPETTARQ